MHRHAMHSVANTLPSNSNENYSWFLLFANYGLKDQYPIHN